MNKISEQDELLLQRIIQLNIQVEDQAKQLKLSRANVCESFVSTTEMVNSMDYQIEEQNKIIEQQGGVLETYRKQINALEHEVRLNKSYSNRANVVFNPGLSNPGCSPEN